jgi:hypothetical protein
MTVKVLYSRCNCDKCRNSRLPTTNRIRMSLNRMEQEGRRDRLKEVEKSKTLRLWDLVDRSRNKKEKEKEGI